MSKRTLAGTGVVAGLAAGLLLALPLAASATEEAAERARRIVERSAYQREWPMAEGACPGGEDSRGGELCAAGKPRERRQVEASPRQRTRSGGSTPAVAPVMGLVSQALLWMLALVVAVVVAVFLFRLFEQWQGRPRGGSGMTGGMAAAPAPGQRGKMVDVERLAREGHYGEAVHLLLLMAVERLSRHRGESLDPSLTSREILRRLRLGEGGRAALERLVLGTERFLFAEEAVDQSEFEACRQAFDTLAGSPS